MPDHQSPAGSEDRIHQRQSRPDSRPVEYYIDEKWDKCIDLTLRRVTYSSLAAGAVALVVLSELVPQSAFHHAKEHCCTFLSCCSFSMQEGAG